MSILIMIKDMEMPNSCMNCMFCGFAGANCELDLCQITGIAQKHIPYSKMPDCPLVEVPTPHGRLIDADKLRAEFPHPNDWRNPELAYAHLSGIWATIDCAEAIIEAESGT